MPIKSAGALFALLELAGLGGCAATRTAAGANETTCRADAATALIGRAAPDDAAIRRQTGSTLVRRIAPGDMVTQDYRKDRVTVTIAEGRVTSAACG